MSEIQSLTADAFEVEQTAYLGECSLRRVTDTDTFMTYHLEPEECTVRKVTVTKKTHACVYIGDDKRTERFSRWKETVVPCLVCKDVTRYLFADKDLAKLWAEETNRKIQRGDWKEGMIC